MRPSFFFFCGSYVTIYRIYVDNGNRAGFWVQHRSWDNKCGHVESIAGQAAGALGATDGSDAVAMRMFDIRSGRPILSPSAGDYPGDRNYTQIAEPYWCHGLESERV